MADALAGQVALITGCAQGIGLAIADRFRLEGCQVIGMDRVDQGQAIVADLADLESIPGIIEGLRVTPTLLVNCAGVCFTRPFFDIDMASASKTFAVNVLAPLALMQAFALRLKNEGKSGAVINISSNSGYMPKLEQLDYGASKAALMSMTKSAALSLAPFGIRVNAVAPGVIDTPLTQSIAQQRSEIRGVPPEETLRPVIGTLPLGRMGSADEVANIALFLASNEASYVTGQTILVDGGQYMR
ncbi:MAG TPA: SDR family oxidoreductase [Fimbriimonas sp.]|nr:SDR family oxidoreductase [Fimbriimonas sp.]